MLIIGLTGGIGAGKTTVANLFADNGTPIIDADVIAREVTQPPQPAFMTIAQHFKDILTADNTLNRKKLRRIIFESPPERQWLENLLHPLIETEIKKQLNKIRAPFCIVVIPLLIEVLMEETKTYSFIDRILVVDAPESLQLTRVATRDQAEKKEIEAILHAQIKRDARLTKAHDVIVNDGTLAAVAIKVQRLRDFYLQLAA